MKGIVIGIVVVALLAVAIYYVAGPQKAVYGAEVTGEQPTAVSELLNNPKEYVGQEVVVEGKITKECPTSGCWWYLHDGTGEIRADSNGGNFALPVGREGSTVRVQGKVVASENGQVEIAALGAEL